MAEKPLDVPDRIDGYEKGQEPDDYEEKSRQEVEPEMKWEVGQTDRQNSLISVAACHGPDTCDSGEKRSDGGKGKTRTNEEPLVIAQKRRQRKKEQKHSKRQGYNADR
jgi:hypothetical protein